MKTELLVTVTKIVINPESDSKKTFTATVQSNKSESHSKYSLLYEGWISKWVEIKD